MIYILYGEDDYTQNETLTEIKRELGSPDFLYNNTSVLDGKNLNLEQLKIVCDAIPFFSSHRLVIVSGLLERFEVKRNRKSDKGPNTSQASDYIGMLEYYLKDLPESTVLVFIDTDVKTTNPIIKKLTPLVNIMHFPMLRGRSLYSWVQKRVHSMGYEISSSTSKLLCDFTGNNLWILSNEIDKLALFSSNQTITEADIYACVSYARQANIFAMMDAIIGNRTDVAQSLANQLIYEGTKVSQILGFIVRQLRLILSARQLLEKGTSMKIAQSSLGLSSSYAFEKILAQSKAFDYEHLKRNYLKILDTDLAIKRGQMTDDLAIELLVAELCHT